MMHTNTATSQILSNTWSSEQPVLVIRSFLLKQEGSQQS
jgi:hypothetical protein